MATWTMRELPTRFDSSTTVSMNTMVARPRGPNQPAKAIVCAAAPEPISDNATGTILTTVRLRTAYTTVDRSRSVMLRPTTTAPKTKNVTVQSNPPTSSIRRVVP